MEETDHLEDISAEGKLLNSNLKKKKKMGVDCIQLAQNRDQ